MCIRLPNPPVLWSSPIVVILPIILIAPCIGIFSGLLDITGHRTAPLIGVHFLAEHKSSTKNLFLIIQEDGTNRPQTVSSQKLSPKWCFLDSTTADRFYRIDRAQEHLNFVLEICQDELYVLDPELIITQSVGTSPAMPDSKDHSASPTNRHFQFPLQPPTSPPESPAVSELQQGYASRGRTGSDSSMSKMDVSSGYRNGNNISDYNPDEALLESAKNDDLEKFREAHRAGGNLTQRDFSGCTLLHHAVNAGSKEIVRYIIENAPSEILDVAELKNRETSLHLAASLRQRTICHFIVEAGASLMKTDLQGDTPKNRAEKAKDSELAAYLENRQHYQMIQREDQETAV